MPKSKEQKLEAALIEAIKVTRHSRNVLFSISVEQLRSEGVMAETKMEEILGIDEYRNVCDKAFNSPQKPA